MDFLYVVLCGMGLGLLVGVPLVVGKMISKGGNATGSGCYTIDGYHQEGL